MMGIPLILIVALAAHLIPILTILWLWGWRPPAPYGRLLALVFVLFLSGMIELVLALNSVPNLWISWFALPIEAVLMFWMLRDWHHSGFMRRLYEMVACALVIWILMMVLLAHPRVTFDVWTWPLTALILLAASAHTLVARSLDSRQLLTGQGWFWVCLGVMLFWLGSVPVTAFSQAVLNVQIGWALSAYSLRSGLNIIAFLLLAWGAICHHTQARSSGLSSVPA